jgi:hypothetical protein
MAAQERRRVFGLAIRLSRRDIWRDGIPKVRLDKT